MSKKVVICDTMIWYHIADGEESLQKNTYHYCATTTNIVDFFSSGKITDSEEAKTKLKSAIIAMNENADEIYFLDPTTEARRLLYGINNFDDEIQAIKKDYSELLRYARGEVNFIFGPAIESAIQAKTNFQDLALSFKKQLDQMFKKDKKHKKYSDDEKNEIIKGNIILYLHKNFERMNHFQIYPESIDWSNVSVFINAFCAYLKDVKVNDLSLIHI